MRGSSPFTSGSGKRSGSSGFRSVASISGPWVRGQRAASRSRWVATLAHQQPTRGRLYQQAGPQHPQARSVTRPMTRMPPAVGAFSAQCDWAKASPCTWHSQAAMQRASTGGRARGSGTPPCRRPRAWLAGPRTASCKGGNQVPQPACWGPRGAAQLREEQLPPRSRAVFPRRLTCFRGTRGT